MLKQIFLKNILWVFVLVTVILLIAGIPGNAEETPAQALQVSYKSSSIAGGDVIVTFSLPMVEAGELETAGHPEVLFEPEQEGTFKWRSPTELVFSPAEGAMNWGQQISIAINEAVPLAGKEYALQSPWRQKFTVPFLRIAGKVANWPVVKGQPRFINFLNWHSGWVGRGPLFLLYDQPIEIGEVEKWLKITDEAGKLLEIEIYRPESTSHVFEGKIDPTYLVAVSILDLPEHNKTVIVKLPDWKEQEKPELLKKSLTVNSKFKLTKSRIAPSRGDGRVSLKTTWYLEFNNRFNVDQFRDVLQITPQPKTLRVSGYGWSGARIRVELEPGTQYRMMAGREFIDILGNPLSPSLDISFKSQDLPPVLHVPAAPVLLERETSRLPVKLRNIEDIEIRVFRFDAPQDFAKALESGRKKGARQYGFEGRGEKLPLPDWTFEPNVIQFFDLPLDVAPGLFCLEVRAFGAGSEAKGMLRDAILVQITDLGLTTKVFENRIFAWITRLHNAAPLEGARVSLYDKGQKISEGFTDVSGVISLEAKDAASGTGLQRPVVLVAEKFGYIAVSRLVDGEISHSWQFGLKGKVKGAGVLPAAVFTDRGVYRPGEVVHFKIIVGKAPDIQNDEVVLHVRDPRGQQTIKRTLSLDRFGSADLDLKLKEQAAVGEYLVQVDMGENKTIRRFRVEEYRVPTFQVSVKSDQETWQHGEDLSAVIRAEYLHGGKLGGREARWEVLRKPEFFAPAAFPKYVFNLGDAANFAGSIASGKERLDGQGQLVVQFKADHLPLAGPMRYIVEAAVTDVDRQTYAGRLSKIIHPTEFYVGVRPPSRQVLTEGEKLQVPVIAVGLDGTPIEDIQVQARLERLDYHTTARMSKGGIVQLLNRAVPVEQQQYTLTTRKTPVNCTFEFPGAGFYLVRFLAQDSQHRTVQTGFQITISGDKPTAWPRFDQDQIEVIADKSSYKIGDVARLVVQTPYKRAQGLLTVERDGVLEYRVFTIEDDTPAIELPIKADYAPNVFASVVLLRGRIHHEKDASGFETGAPGFKIGYARLNVDPGKQRLSVKVDPSSKTANPGQKIKINLSVRDHNGEPVSGQATVMVVDEAVLGLTGYRTPDPVAQIYVERFLGVRTGSSRLDLPHARRSRLEKIFPGGDSDRAALLLRDLEALRKLFMSTAYWNPKVPVGEDGMASVEFELPDNLTTFRIMAVVTDESRRTGSADNQMLVRKPLMIQPVLPRFIYPDDELQVEALVFNGTNTDGDVHLTGEFANLKLVKGTSEQQTSIKSGGSSSFKFPVKVTGEEEAVIRFTAKLGDYTDAVQIKLPILGPGNRRTVVASKSILDSDTVSVTLPAERVPGSVKMEVVTSTTVLSELKDSVQYLMRYPNGCIEQTTSTAYPLVVLKDLLPEIGIEVDQADLKKFSEAGIRRILSFQTPSGGLSYWPGSSEPHAFATAFGLTALIEAKKQNYDVPDEALAGMADYLEQSLRKGEITGEMPHGGMADADTRALFVMTLGRLGRPQPGYISVLWNKREELTAFGLSFLAIAVKEMAGDQSLLEAILAEVRKAAMEEEKEAYFSGKPKGGWSLDSPLRTHGVSLIAFASAGGEGETTGKFLTGLLKRRIRGLWGNTQENVFAIMGVHAAAARKAGGDAPQMEMKIRDRDIPDSEMEKVSERVRRLTLEESDLALIDGMDETRGVRLKNNGGAPIILTLRAQYDVPLNEKNRRAQSHGFTLTRQYETPEGESLEGKSIPLGSLVRVRLHVTTTADHHYVAIDDKLPAGLEPLNINLETTEKVSLGEFTADLQRGLSVLSYQEIRDSRVAFYADEILPGEYEYVYVARATTPGRFLRPAGRVEAMYQPEIHGMTSIDEVIIDN